MKVEVRGTSTGRRFLVLALGLLLPNGGDQRLATKGLSVQPDFIASPLHRVVRLSELAGRSRPQVPQGVADRRKRIPPAQDGCS